MGVGKNERLGVNDSRFGKGRRIDATNDRIIRQLKVRGGRLQKVGDHWTLKVDSTVSDGEEPGEVEIPDVTVELTEADTEILDFGDSFEAVESIGVNATDTHQLDVVVKTYQLPEFPDPDAPIAEDCQHDVPPGGGASGGASNDAEPDERDAPGGSSEPSGSSGDRDHDNFPSKIGPCW